MDALRQTMLVQAQVVQNVEVDSGELARLVTQSQAAVGNLQALQATNQLIALSTKQQLQTQEMVAAQYRAEALERARATTAQEQAQTQFSRFLGDGSAYPPRQYDGIGRHSVMDTPNAIAQFTHTFIHTILSASLLPT